MTIFEHLLTMEKTQKQVLQTSEEITPESGIDFTAYRNTEILEKVMSLILFQKYSASFLYKPVSVFLLLYITGFFIFNAEIAGMIVYGIAGFAIFSFNGVLAGLLLLLSNLKKDFKIIINSSLELTETLFNDVHILNTTIKNSEYPVCIIFNGIIKANILSALDKKLIRIPFIGKRIVNSTDKVVDLITEQLKNYENQLNIKKQIIGRSNVLLNAGMNANIKSILQPFSGNIEETINKRFAVLEWPLKTMFVLSLVLTGFFLIIFAFVT